jgi:hypothetical protein
VKNQDNQEIIKSNHRTIFKIRKNSVYKTIEALYYGLFSTENGIRKDGYTVPIILVIIAGPNLGAAIAKRFANGGCEAGLRYSSQPMTGSYEKGQHTLH